jgi:hypothetical protein
MAVATLIEGVRQALADGGARRSLAGVLPHRKDCSISRLAGKVPR